MAYLKSSLSDLNEHRHPFLYQIYLGQEQTIIRVTQIELEHVIIKYDYNE